MTEPSFTCKDFPGLMMHKFKRIAGEDLTAARCSNCKAVYDTDFVVAGEICPSCEQVPLKLRKTWIEVCENCGVQK